MNIHTKPLTLHKGPRWAEAYAITTESITLSKLEPYVRTENDSL
jgi:hypothetical protein